MHADPTRAHIPVELDRERILCFDHRATWLLMQKYGPSFMSEIFEKDSQLLGGVRVRSLDVLVYFLWAGLQRDAQEAGETLSIDDVEDLIDPLSIQRLFVGLVRALNRPSQRKNGHPAGDAGALAEVSENPQPLIGKKRNGSPTESSD